jgi:hypothetical protein
MQRRVATMPSTDGRRTYVLAKNDRLSLSGPEGYSCSCTGWINHHTDCKHIRQLKRFFISSSARQPTGLVITNYGAEVGNASRLAAEDPVPQVRQTIPPPQPEIRPPRSTEDEPAPTLGQLTADTANLPTPRRSASYYTPPPAPPPANAPAPRDPGPSVARVWPPLRQNLTPTGSQSQQTPVSAPQQASGERCETCGIDKSRHGRFCKAADVDAKMAAEREPELEKTRFKVLDIEGVQLLRQYIVECIKDMRSKK